MKSHATRLCMRVTAGRSDCVYVRTYVRTYVKARRGARRLHSHTLRGACRRRRAAATVHDTVGSTTSLLKQITQEYLRTSNCVKGEIVSARVFSRFLCSQKLCLGSNYRYSWFCSDVITNLKFIISHSKHLQVILMVQLTQI